MKRLSHRHLVRIVGSYTDSQCFAFLMEPVAQCNMSQYLQSVASPQIPSLRKFFGCLSNAVTYLHDQKMHHLDIKLENILVKRDEVFVGDFGAAHDFSRKERSTTWSPTPRTARYMPPEIARDPHSPKNYATDIWSLGVVFLEMTAVLRGQSLKSFHSYLLNHGTKHAYVYGNQAATHSYFEFLRTRGTGPEHDNEPLSWVKDMTNMNSIGRPTARAIRNQILQSSSVEQFRSFCCAGTNLWWDPAPSGLGAVLNDSEESVNFEDDFFETNEVLDNAYTSLDPSKTHRIESWLNRSTVPPHPEPDANTSNDDAEMPFDIEDDEETIMPSTTKEYALNRFAGRLANFDFLCSSPSTSHPQKPVVCGNIGDELPFDINDDDANSLDSEISIRPAVNGPTADGAEILEALNSLDRISSSSELPDVISDALSNETPVTAIQTSAKFDAPSRTTSELITDKSPGKLSVCNISTVSDEILTTSNPALRELDSIQRSIPEELRKCRTGQISADKVRSIVQNNQGSSSQSKLDPALLKLVQEIPTNQVEPPSLPENLSSPSQPALESSFHIPTKRVSSDEVKSLDPPEKINLPSQPASKASLSRKNKKPPPEKTRALTLENLLELEQHGKPEVPKMPRNKKLGTYAGYMQDVWEAESSQATTAMSERTKHQLRGSANMISWQDNSFDWLPTFVSEGKVEAVRKLLELGCNPGTKVSGLSFLLRYLTLRSELRLGGTQG